MLFVWAEGEAPEFCSCCFTPSGEDGGTIFGKDSDRVFLIDDFATIVAEWANAHDVVLEGGHDVCITGG